MFEGISDVFAQINAAGAGGVTAGLKKVTADMKTKNRPPGEVRNSINSDDR